MNDTIDLQNGCRGPSPQPQATGRAAVVGSVFLLLAVSTYGSDNESAKPDAVSVGPNQSVALEQVVPASPDAGVTAAAGPHEPPEVQGKDSSGATTPRPASKGRMLRRRSESEKRPFESKAVTPPWYRTGLGALAIVLAIVGGLYYLLRRCVPSMRAMDSGIVRVVGRSSLTPKHQVVLVQLGRHFLAVGISGDRMTTLSQISDPGEVAELAARAGVQTAGRSDGFDELLLREAAEYRTPSDETDETLASTSDKVSTNRGPVRDLLRKLQTLRLT